MTHCPECHAPSVPRSCEDLFQKLLALDHSRQPPWGPLHGVSVSCFLLQHHSRIPAAGAAAPWAILHAYLEGGLDSVNRRTGRARRSNSHRGHDNAPVTTLGTAVPATNRPPTRFRYTITDVAQDGGFPASGFPERVQAWAAATVDAWTSRPS
ncbi:DUF5946 family protein [Marinitenerispora sediminis]|uniref:Uncharacterized protein n=1 Tax=Marinitenerispora sediminis TaxID=1931232 RepID=A0A368T2Y4_9ACTN|nr:DUF5946 family protein [Marinitenerispora sediminis]RCV47686.1 hypothetical protein DEF23_26355 [Marinitenerispora sediminis]RCV48016.1 hypothetical protein DEF28_24675 [Marinitenerispora sediminis]RCV51018.1 hypothetical protein DEF24_23610 [Marinitenerispora sediminis]